jgi:hypothetical protein
MSKSDNALAADTRQSYQAWLQELRATLTPARQAEAGVWTRWRVAQYLEHAFAPRFREEHETIRETIAQAPATYAVPIWALGELVELLADHVASLGRTVQHGARFASAADKLLVAFECWCDHVEQTIDARDRGAHHGLVAQPLAPLHGGKASTAVPSADLEPAEIKSDLGVAAGAEH